MRHGKRREIGYTMIVANRNGRIVYQRQEYPKLFVNEWNEWRHNQDNKNCNNYWLEKLIGGCR